MEKNVKKSQYSFPFDNGLFSQADIDIINEKTENNIALLYNNLDYNDLDDKLLDINVKLSSFLDENQFNLFNEYIRLSLEANNYKNCLAYYLGIQEGMNINSLK